MSDIREAFEALEELSNRAHMESEEYEMSGGGKETDRLQNIVKAALSANGGEVEPVAWAVFADNGNIRIWGREKPEAFPEAVPLYLGPTVKDSLTVQSEPIGYADPDTLADYRAGDRLHMPVYRPDASADWQDGIPVYLHPAPPSVAVPEGWDDDAAKQLEQARQLQEAQYGSSAQTLTAAPSPDHSGDAGKVVCHAPSDRCRACPHYFGKADRCDYAAPSPDHSGDANKMVTPERFKAFHAALCRRFGYTHDERYWWRDLVSLEDHIAAKVADHIADAGKVDGVDGWPGSITRSQAIKILDRATDKDDPHWEFVVDDFYDEDSDTMPSIFHVFAAIGVTEEEYREAAGVQNIDWPASATPSVPENEIKALALEEYADQLDAVFANAQEAGATDCPAWHAGQFAKDARKQAARLRTAGDEGEGHE